MELCTENILLNDYARVFEAVLAGCGDPVSSSGGIVGVSVVNPRVVLKLVDEFVVSVNLQSIPSDLWYLYGGWKSFHSPGEEC